jgi:lipopolysaccharide biosynthesis glycosyltransferase
MRDLHVACATEGSYVPHSAAMLHSLLVSATDAPVRVHYLHGPDFARTDAELLTKMVESNGGAISFTSVPDELCAGLPTEGFTGKATWYRVLVPQLLPNLERVLFLDLDLIITGSLQALWEKDLRGSYVAAVTNVLPHHYAEALAAAGFDCSTYFNAGVMLMDLERMRQDRCMEAMVDYGVSNADGLVLRDQDALNAVLGQRRLKLAPRWNCMNSFFVYPWSADVFDRTALDAAKRHPAIRHFEGPGMSKPWHYLCEQDSRELYALHRRQTPWPRFRPEGRTPKTVFYRLKRELRKQRWTGPLRRARARLRRRRGPSKRPQLD